MLKAVDHVLDDSVGQVCADIAAEFMPSEGQIASKLRVQHKAKETKKCQPRILDPVISIMIRYYPCSVSRCQSCIHTSACSHQDRSNSWTARKRNNRHRLES